MFSGKNGLNRLTLWTPEAGIPGQQFLSISPETGILVSGNLIYHVRPV